MDEIGAARAHMLVHFVGLFVSWLGGESWGVSFEIDSSDLWIVDSGMPHLPPNAKKLVLGQIANPIKTAFVE